MDVDKSLDEIIAGNPEVKSRRGGGHRRGGGRGRGRGGHAPRDRIGKRGHEDAAPSGRRGGRGTTIMISNLYYNLNEADLEELFGKVGPIQRVKIQYDKSGRSEGYAWVTFDRYDDALEAVARYDGKRAAGQIIGITMARGYGFKQFEGNSFSKRLDRRPPNSSSRGGRGSRPPARPKKTAEELDAELDAYMGSNVDESKTEQDTNDTNRTNEPNNDEPTTAAPKNDEESNNAEMLLD